DRAAVREHDTPAPRVRAIRVGARAIALDGARPLEPDGARAEPDRALGKALREPVDQRLHAVAKAREETPARAAVALRRGPRLPAHREDDAAVTALHLDETRHRRREAESRRVGGVDAADERLGNPLERLGAETTAHEGVQALVVV